MTYTTGPFKSTIDKLHELGMSISIDDFGTGYSSLIRLKHLPISTLKIETSFIQDAVINQNSAIIVRCVIALGKNLGLNVIAEGIETQEQLDFLIKNDCPQGQGFFLSRPLTTAAMTKLLEENLKQKIKTT
jgi:EAL domain-containing protein (putative c-di-GMP-specific phosphodiesterase class I)